MIFAWKIGNVGFCYTRIEFSISFDLNVYDGATVNACERQIPFWTNVCDFMWVSSSHSLCVCIHCILRCSKWHTFHSFRIRVSGIVKQKIFWKKQTHARTFTLTNKTVKLPSRRMIMKSQMGSNKMSARRWQKKWQPKLGKRRHQHNQHHRSI